VMPARPADQQQQPPPSSVTAGGVPVIDPDVPAVDIPMTPSPGEPGAHEFGRDLAVWTARLFDQPVKSLRYRENPADHRPCPRAGTYQVVVAAHVVLVTTYDSHPCRERALTVYAVHVDGMPVPFTPRRPAVRLDWQLAWAAWKAVKDRPRP
jgi:hypothetical protein